MRAENIAARSTNAATGMLVRRRVELDKAVQPHLRNLAKTKRRKQKRSCLEYSCPKQFGELVPDSYVFFFFFNGDNVFDEKQELVWSITALVTANSLASFFYSIENRKIKSVSAADTAKH